MRCWGVSVFLQSGLGVQKQDPWAKSVHDVLFWQQACVAAWAGVRTALDAAAGPFAACLVETRSPGGACWAEGTVTLLCEPAFDPWTERG